MGEMPCLYDDDNNPFEAAYEAEVQRRGEDEVNGRLVNLIKVDDEGSSHLYPIKTYEGDFDGG